MRFYATPDNKIKLINADCFAVMPRIAAGSVDMIMADLPYGTTACKWDNILPIDQLWSQYARITRYAAAKVFTASQPFASNLVSSNFTEFKYEIIWDKVIPGGMSYARFQPMRQHETVLIFSDGTPVYNPQKTKRDKPIKSGGQTRLNSELTTLDNCKVDGFNKTYEDKNPTSIVKYMKVRRGSVHPTQKPVALMEYLIKTYTNPDELVLDNVMGSGTTAVACINTDRRCIGIELDEDYFDIAVKRCEEAYNNKVRS